MDVVCLKMLSKGPFFEEYLICLDSMASNSPLFNLRAMRKPTIALSKNDEDIVMFELMIRSKIRYPFLVNQICAFQDYDNLYYVTEYAAVRLLDSNILPKKFSTDVTKFYAAQMFLCLKYMHSKKQNYTFLSFRNVLLAADGHIKLDYSFCNCLEYSKNSIYEDIAYLSPDYLENNRFSYIGDYWSLGVVIYQLIHGYLPFSSPSFNQTVAEVRRGKPVIEEQVDTDTRNIIQLLLDRDLCMKYTTCELLETEIANHTFFQDINWKKMENKEYEPPFLIKIPEYNAKISPKLGSLYTSDFIVPGKDGYGNIFARYNTVHFLLDKKSL